MTTERDEAVRVLERIVATERREIGVPLTTRADRIAALDLAIAALRDGEGEVVELVGVEETVAEGYGRWLTCSGCHDSNEGQPTGPWSKTLACHLGMGCRECGGIGAVWDTTDYEAFAADLLNAEAPPTPQQPEAQAVAWRKVWPDGKVGPWRLLPVPEVVTEDEKRQWCKVEYATHPTTPAVGGESEQPSGEVRGLLAECYEWLFEGKSCGPRVSEGALTNGSYTREFHEFHDRLEAALATKPAKE